MEIKRSTRPAIPDPRVALSTWAEPTFWWAALPRNPFRVFFPLGVLCGVLGVGHWVLWSVGFTIPNVALTHAFLQTQGFLTSFVVGFVMTAFPRFTGTWPAGRFEMTVMLSASVSVLIALLRHNWLAAQCFFLVLILNLAFFGGRRLPHRTKALPPSFLLMGFGFLHAVVGSTLLLVSHFGASNFVLFSEGRQMIQVGFLLCIVLGVTGKIAPFLLGYTDAPEQEAGKRLGFRTGRMAMALHGLTGAALFASFFIDNGSPRVGSSLRAVLVTLHMTAFAGIARPLKNKAALRMFFHLSMAMVPLGLWVAFLRPDFRMAALHILFIGGFSLMIFSFGLLVVLSHSAKAALVNAPLKPMKVIGALVLSALATRLLAEVVPGGSRLLIHVSSCVWVAAAVVWAAYTMPLIAGGPNPGH